ncbi:MAG: tetratricopeptide repeat protein [Planctomycetia bacterium]|nr:tetratricopeptide repeat protein [Planctomycetia bacterium]
MPDPSSEQPPAVQSHANRRRQAVCCLATILVVGTVFMWVRGHVASNRTSDKQGTEEDVRRQSLAAEYDRFLDAEIVPSRFRNASKTVGYVGSRECVKCHRDEHASYLKTTHSRSLAEVDVSREPPDAEYYHELSGRHYRIYRDGETLRLREFIQDEQGQEVVLVDHAARFAMGSGNYARAYLVQVDDFLIQAPVRWLPRLSTWGMAAGYENDPRQQGFGREIGWGCLDCHAGRVEMIDGAFMRLNVPELAIGCERCHGPGGLHVQERQAELPIRGGFDDSIVNLRHLSRERQEDVCSQCHLSGIADADVRGRSKADFRPGLRMSDFHISYRIERPESPMAVSGQIEHMRLSRCYLESKTMTCATCHNPHALPDESEKVDYYRNKCLSCHQVESCGLSVEARREQQTQDNCIVCHMPRGPTDIPHFSFTHHRVGIHAANPQNDRLTESDQLVPVQDVSHLPEHERLRLLGLANNFFAAQLAGGLNDESRDDPSYRALSRVFSNRAVQLLEDIRSRGLRDADVEIFFSCWNWRRNPHLCIADAESALASKQVPPGARRTALYNLASSHFDQGRYQQASPYLEELVKIERSEISLMLLAICHERQGNLAEAVRLVNAAILDAPDRADLHAYLARIYQKMGKANDAESHLHLASLLRLRVPQPE